MRFENIVLTSFAAFGLAACQPQVASVESVPAAVELHEDSANTAVTAAAFTAKGEKIAGAKVEWTTSDPKIVTVDATGVLTSVGSGEAVVTAKVGEHSGKSTVRVALATTIKVEPATAQVELGSRPLALTATVLDEAGRPLTVGIDGLKWSVNDPSIATIDDKGMLTPVAEGVVTANAQLRAVKANAAITVIQPQQAAELEVPAQP